MNLFDPMRGVVRQWLLALFTIALMGSTAQADEAPFPSKPLKLIVPYAPGGGTDNTARRFAEFLARKLGQTVVVENRPGAATNIGGQALASASADGYTVLFGTNQTIINSVFGPKPPFDPVTAFAPVGLIAEVPYVMAVRTDSPVQQFKDLLASGGKGGVMVAHAQFEAQLQMLSQVLPTPIVGIPYQGGSPAIAAVLSGDVPAVFTGVAAVTGTVKAGRLRLIGVTSATRLNAFPEVPTFAEQGYPAFVTTGWYGVLAPKGTPEPVLRRLSEATLAVAKDPAFVDSIRLAGAEPLAAGGSQMATRMAADRASWAKVAR